jgi:hypothetical protein
MLDGASFARDVEVAFPVFFRGAPKHAGERLADFFAAFSFAISAGHFTADSYLCKNSKRSQKRKQG